MANFGNLLAACGQTFVAGFKTQAYWIKESEVADWPEYLPAGNPGDTVIYDDDVILNAGAFWRQLDISINSGNFKTSLVGEAGAKCWEGTMTFKVPGTCPEQIELAKCIGNDCLIWAFCDKNGKIIVLGSPGETAETTSIEIDWGTTKPDFNGSTYGIKSSGACPVSFYDPNGSLDLIP